MLFVGTSIIHPSTEGVFLLCNILDLLIYSYIIKYLQDMKPEWRDVAILHFIEERPISEVSQILGIKEASCRMRLTRLRRYLKKNFPYKI